GIVLDKLERERIRASVAGIIHLDDDEAPDLDHVLATYSLRIIRCDCRRNGCSLCSRDSRIRIILNHPQRPHFQWITGRDISKDIKDTFGRTRYTGHSRCLDPTTAAQLVVSIIKRVYIIARIAGRDTILAVTRRSERAYWARACRVGERCLVLVGV